MKLIYKLLPLFIVKIAWAYDLAPNYRAENHLKYTGTVTIKSNAPIGTKIIGPLEGHMKTRVNGNCPKNNTYVIAKTSEHNKYVDIYEGNKVYATGTAGIGYAVIDYSHKPADNEPWHMWGMTDNFGFTSGEMGGYAGVIFYKTGDIKTDTTVKDFNLANFYLWCNGGGPTRPMAIYKFSGMLTVKVENNNNTDQNNGGQGGNSGNSGWNNGGQGGNNEQENKNSNNNNNSNNNSNKEQENKNPFNNKNNNNIWPNNNSRI